MRKIIKYLKENPDTKFAFYDRGRTSSEELVSYVCKIGEKYFEIYLRTDITKASKCKPITTFAELFKLDDKIAKEKHRRIKETGLLRDASDFVKKNLNGKYYLLNVQDRLEKIYKEHSFSLKFSKSLRGFMYYTTMHENYEVTIRVLCTEKLFTDVMLSDDLLSIKNRHFSIKEL